jgi:hypothetical protein
MTALGDRAAVSKSPNHIGGKAAVWFPWLSPLSLRLLRTWHYIRQTRHTKIELISSTTFYI